jgi:serpin B
MEAVVEGNTEFAFDLYAKLKDDPEIKEDGGNLFFSPYSISTALAMTWAGARGMTEKQMAEVLHFTLPQAQLHKAFGALEKQLNEAGEEGRYELSVANALWGQAGLSFLEEFLELTEKSYGAGLKKVDFVTQTEQARRIINAWVEEKTKEKIKNLIKLGVLDPLTRLVLTNAIYFKGDWASRFDKKRTRDEPFKLKRREQVKVPMMHVKDKFKYWADDKLQVLQLPYKDEELSMVILLPNEVDGLAEMEKTLTSENLEKWLKGLRKQEVMVTLPKFKMTTDFELAEYLKKMGMPDAFRLPPADFAGMTGDKSLFISAVIHKAFVAVDEEGTEAAAATAVVMSRTSVPAPPKVFRADHPFIFIIKDNRSQSILFMGRVMNPEQKDEQKP